MNTIKNYTKLFNKVEIDFTRHRNDLYFKMGKLAITAIFLFCTLIACKKEAQQAPDDNPQEYDLLAHGKKLENPYSVTNMRIALANLKKQSLDRKSGSAKTSSSEYDVQEEDFEGIEIEATHLYVSLRPETEQEEGLIKADSSVVWFDYPLDYEFTDEELAARPPLGENEFPTYYSAIKVIGEDDESEPEAGENASPEIALNNGEYGEYKVIEELYIPEEDDYFEGAESETTLSDENTPNSKLILMKALLAEAFKITENTYESTPSKNNNSEVKFLVFGKKWTPRGNISVWDSRLGRNVPVIGAQVLIRQWFTVRQGITNANGDFSTGTVRGSARYIVQWERYHYSIRSGTYGQAESRGPQVKNQNWNVTFAAGSRDAYYAMVHQAAHDYYYGNRFGLTSPPLNRPSLLQMKIGAYEKQGNSDHISIRTFYGGPQIAVREWESRSDEVYGTTIHELAHAAHRVVDASSYNNIVWNAYTNPLLFHGNDPAELARNKRRLMETWATTVEIVFANHRYGTILGINGYTYGREINFQRRTIDYLGTSNDNNDRYYTSCGFDLIDTENQRLLGQNFPQDRVSGYNVAQLEQSLEDAIRWEDWRDNIITDHNNTTEGFVNELFANWRD